MKRLIRPRHDLIQTKDKPTDYTSGNAANRVLLINFWIIKYGTNDKFQGAAILFCFFLFVLIGLTFCVGMLDGDNNWLDKIFNWLSSTFILVLGIAIGRAGDSQNDPQI